MLPSKGIPGNPIEKGNEENPKENEDEDKKED